MMVLQLIWVSTMVPETKGVPLEDDAGHAWDEATGGRVLARQMTGMVFGVGEDPVGFTPVGAPARRRTCQLRLPRRRTRDPR